jgi:hypothetical protein
MKVAVAEIFRKPSMVLQTDQYLDRVVSAVNTIGLELPWREHEQTILAIVHRVPICRPTNFVG